MSRNNQDRLGASSPQPADVPPPAITDSSLNFTVPTEFVELPTQGRFYAEGHPLHGKDCIEIRYMTAKDEDILSSKVLLKKGLAIDRFLSNIIIDKSVNVDELIVADKNAILVAARITGYGAEYKTGVICPQCLTRSEYEFDLSLASINTGGAPGEYDIESGQAGSFFITVPKTGAKVEIQPLYGKHEKQIIAVAERRKKNKLPENNTTTQLQLIIKSVNGNEDKGYIKSFVNAVPALDARYIRKAVEQYSPAIDLSQEFNCPECDTRTVLEVPFTSEFLWPK